MRRLLPLMLCALMLSGCNVGIRSMHYSRPVYTPVYAPVYRYYPVYRVPVLSGCNAPPYYPRVRMVPQYRYYPRR